MYYVRRDGRIKGPLSREKLRSLRQEKRLRMRDEISTAADGPWRLLRDVREEVLGRGEVPRGDSGIWSDAPEPLTPADDEGLIEREPSDQEANEQGPNEQEPNEQEYDGEWHESLRNWLEGDDPFRRPFRPWMYALGAMLLVVLGVLALSVVFGTH